MLYFTLNQRFICKLKCKLSIFRSVYSLQPFFLFAVCKLSAFVRFTSSVYKFGLQIFVVSGRQIFPAVQFPTERFLHAVQGFYVSAGSGSFPGWHFVQQAAYFPGQVLVFLVGHFAAHTFAYKFRCADAGTLLGSAGVQGVGVIVESAPALQIPAVPVGR